MQYNSRNFVFISKFSCQNSSFKKYKVCIKCCTLHDIEQCRVNDPGAKESKRYLFVKSQLGKSILLPFKTYWYRPLKKSLEILLSRDGFEIDCEKWHNLEKDSEVLADVYDGNISKTLSSNDKWYFEEKRNLPVMLNVNLFKPFKHLCSFCVGGIYLVVLNLLRTGRYKRKNVILVGIIPNMMKEPPANNSLKLMVDELNEAWNIGFNIKSIVNNKVEVFHVALICVGCDIPACIVICGFLGKWFNSFNKKQFLEQGCLQIDRIVSFCKNFTYDVIFVSNRKTKCEKKKKIVSVAKVINNSVKLDLI